MRLSKKIAAIFTVTSVITVTLYGISTGLMSKYLYSGEVTRITGITSGCINRVKGEVSKVTGKSRDYSSLLETVDTYNREFNSQDGAKKFGLNEKFKNDKIDYKIVLSSDLEIKEKYEANDVCEESQNEYLTVLEEIKEIIKSGKTTGNGLINGKNYPFIVSFSPKGLQNGGQSEYLVIIDKLNQDVLDDISAQMDKDIKITKEIDEGGKREYSSLTNGEEILLITKNNEVNSYYELSNITGDDSFYIKTSEPLVVRESMMNNSIIIAIVFICISIIINIILLLIIRNMVLKRIERINKGINRVRESKGLEERLTVDNGKDEISILTNDINSMFDALEESNKLFMENEEKSSKLLEGLDNGYAYFGEVRDDEGNIIDANLLDVNASMARILGIGKKRLYRMTFKEIFENKVGDENFIGEILSRNNYEGETLLKSCVGLGNNIWVSIAVYTIENNHFAMLVTDITENRKNAEEMRYLANYDVLTGLQNRYSLYNYMAQLKEDGEKFTIYFIDLDNFKTLNDSLGHNSGDEVLCKAAYVLESLDKNQIKVGRLGGDEFLVVRKGVLCDEEVMELGQKILEALNTTFEYGNFNYELKASIGATSFSNHTNDIETLIRYADIAMYQSKSQGGNNIEVFNETMLEGILIEAALKKAIENKEFFVHYQPIFSVEENRIVGAEALVRWLRDGEIVPPFKFIPIAKRTGDIYEIDNFVLREACNFCKEKRDNGFKDFQVSVNASYRFLKQHNFTKMLKELLEEIGLDPSGLKLEITEDEVLDDSKRIVMLLKEIKELGVKIALDDFGVGYSSFSYIKILPIDTIKIDRSLLSKIEDDSKTVSIIATLINLAHTLDLDVVAEGVEIEDQLELLKMLQCDKIQGYYISKPVHEDEFVKVIEKHNL